MHLAELIAGQPGPVNVTGPNVTGVTQMQTEHDQKLSAAIARRDALLREQRQLAQTIGNVRDMLADQYGEEYDSDDDPTITTLLPIIAEKSAAVAEANDVIASLRKQAPAAPAPTAPAAPASRQTGAPAATATGDASGRPVSRSAPAPAPAPSVSTKTPSPPAMQTAAPSTVNRPNWQNVRRLHTGRPGKPALVWYPTGQPLTPEEKTAYKHHRDQLAAAGYTVPEPPTMTQPNNEARRTAPIAAAIAAAPTAPAPAAPAPAAPAAPASRQTGAPAAQAGQPVGRLDAIERAIADLSAAVSRLSAPAAPAPAAPAAPASRQTGAPAATATGDAPGRTASRSATVGRLNIDARGGDIVTIDVQIDAIRETIKAGYDIRATAIDSTGRNEPVSWYYNPPVMTADRQPPVTIGQQVRITGRLEGRHVSRKRPQPDGQYAYDVSTPILNVTYEL